VKPIEELSEAVRANDAEQVGAVLREHPELKKRLDDELPGGSFGATALLVAVYQGNKEMVEALLSAGADIDARSHWWAGSFGVLDHDGPLVPFLISRGATVDVHAAARLGMLDRLEELLAEDPDLVRARGGDGQTPLHFAPSVEVAAFLLSRGAEIDARDVDHESTPAQYMIRDRHEVARYLVGRGASTDLLMVAALGDVTLVEEHVAVDPAVVRMTASDAWFPRQDERAGGTIYFWTLGAHKTAHLVAREFGHEDAVRALLERSPEGLKLAMACELPDDELLALLRSRHPDVAGALADEDKGRLVIAAETGRTDAVHRMLDAGWPLDTLGSHGGTALHWAAWLGDRAMVDDLLRHQAPLGALDSTHGLTPLGWALHGSKHGWNCKTGDFVGVVTALLAAGAVPPTTEPDASDAVKEILRRNRS
jgi:ankyrin repeat protein